MLPRRLLGLLFGMLLRTPPGRASQAGIHHSAHALRSAPWCPCLKFRSGTPRSTPTSQGLDADLPHPAPQGSVDEHVNGDAPQRRGTLPPSAGPS